MIYHDWRNCCFSQGFVCWVFGHVLEAARTRTVEQLLHLQLRPIPVHVPVSDLIGILPYSACQEFLDPRAVRGK
eukprot:COSAG05_NODE_10767_length_547_cov_1.319196_1_plen_74_part_00